MPTASLNVSSARLPLLFVVHGQGPTHVLLLPLTMQLRLEVNRNAAMPPGLHASKYYPPDLLFQGDKRKGGEQLLAQLWMLMRPIPQPPERT